MLLDAPDLPAPVALSHIVSIYTYMVPFQVNDVSAYRQSSLEALQ